MDLRGLRSQQHFLEEFVENHPGNDHRLLSHNDRRSNSIESNISKIDHERD